MAAIMFILRATEDVLRNYYSCVTNADPGRSNWGNMLNVLEIPILSCPQSLVNLLGQLQRTRNAVMHPRQRNDNEWTLEAAREILDHCRSAIQMMAADANRRSGAST